MGLQKFRADEVGKKQPNGGTPYFTKWVGGPTLALIRNCKIVNANISSRTVYVTGEPDTYTTIPAACSVKKKIVRGYIIIQNGEYVFRVFNNEKFPYCLNT